MKQYLFIITLLIVSCLGLSSCGNDEPKGENKAHRTILVYMVANNSLGQYNYDEEDITEMQTATYNNGLNGGRLIIYHAPKTGNPTLKEITDKGITTIKTYDNDIYSTDPERLETVINDLYKSAPALDYGIILWSHASAWLEYSTSKSAYSHYTSIKPMAFGEDRNHYMKVSSLANILNKHNFSFIYFDCCHMASIEVAYELRHATKYIIGSGTELPAEGMPYDLNIPVLFKNTAQLQKACQNTFEYYDKRTGVLRSCTMSLITTEYLDELASATREIFQSTLSPVENYSVQRYVRYGKCYLYDFADYIMSLKPSTELKQRWENALNKTVLYKNSTPTIDLGDFNKLIMNQYCGLGSFIVNDLSDSTTNGYNNQKWWKDVVKYKFE